VHARVDKCDDDDSIDVADDGNRGDKRCWVGVVVVLLKMLVVDAIK